MLYSCSHMATVGVKGLMNNKFSQVIVCDDKWRRSSAVWWAGPSVIWHAQCVAAVWNDVDFCYVSRCCQWRSQLFEIVREYTKNSTYRRPFMSAVHASLAGIWGYSVPQTKLNLGLVEMQFPAVLRGLLALFSFFLVDILSHSQFLAPRPHYFYANLDNRNDLCRVAGNTTGMTSVGWQVTLWDPYFQKVGVRTPRPPMSPPVAVVAYALVTCYVIMCSLFACLCDCSDCSSLLFFCFCSN